MRKNLIRLFLGVLFVVQLSWANDKKSAREFYQLTVYHFTNASQEKILDDYFQNALLPALHRMDIKLVGVFKAWANDTAANKLIYVLIPLKSLDMAIKLHDKLQDDAAYVATGAGYINAAENNPPYSRMETILLHAFPLAPHMQLPALHAAKKERVYELRSYESATEKNFETKFKCLTRETKLGCSKN